MGKCWFLNLLLCSFLYAAAPCIEPSQEADPVKRLETAFEVFRKSCQPNSELAPHFLELQQRIPALYGKLTPIAEDSEKTRELDLTLLEGLYGLHTDLRVILAGLQTGCTGEGGASHAMALAFTSTLASTYSSLDAFEGAQGVAMAMAAEAMDAFLQLLAHEAPNHSNTADRKLTAAPSAPSTPSAYDDVVQAFERVENRGQKEKDQSATNAPAEAWKHFAEWEISQSKCR